MKALETLEILRDEYRHSSEDVIAIIEAISELKAIQLQTTCDGCIHLGITDGHKVCRSIHQCGVWFPNLKEVK